MESGRVAGLLLTGAGVIGLWGIGFFALDLMGRGLDKPPHRRRIGRRPLKGELSYWQGITSLIQNAGAFFGIFAFSWVTGMFGRRWTFAVFFVLAAIATAGTFWFLNRDDIFWMIPMMGFCQLPSSVATRSTCRNCSRRSSAARAPRSAITPAGCRGGWPVRARVTRPA